VQQQNSAGSAVQRYRNKNTVQIPGVNNSKKPKEESRRINPKLSEMAFGSDQKKGNFLNFPLCAADIAKYRDVSDPGLFLVWVKNYFFGHPVTKISPVIKRNTWTGFMAEAGVEAVTGSVVFAVDARVFCGVVSDGAGVGVLIVVREIGVNCPMEEVSASRNSR
jgi:hypothetical protein